MASITDRRKPRIVYTDIEIFDYLESGDIDPYDLGIYMHLARRGRNSEKGCCQSVKNATRELGTKLTRYKRSLTRLVRLNIIERKSRKGYSSSYYLNDVSAWKQPGHNTTTPQSNSDYPPSQIVTTPQSNSDYPLELKQEELKQEELKKEKKKFQKKKVAIFEESNFDGSKSNGSEKEKAKTLTNPKSLASPVKNSEGLIVDSNPCEEFKRAVVPALTKKSTKDPQVLAMHGMGGNKRDYYRSRAKKAANTSWFFSEAEQALMRKNRMDLLSYARNHYERQQGNTSFSLDQFERNLNADAWLLTTGEVASAWLDQQISERKPTRIFQGLVKNVQEGHGIKLSVLDYRTRRALSLMGEIEAMEDKLKSGLDTQLQERFVSLWLNPPSVEPAKPLSNKERKLASLEQVQAIFKKTNLKSL